MRGSSHSEPYPLEVHREKEPKCWVLDEDKFVVRIVENGAIHSLA